jgi:hypothetical protein
MIDYLICMRPNFRVRVVDFPFLDDSLGFFTRSSSAHLLSWPCPLLPLLFFLFPFPQKHIFSLPLPQPAWNSSFHLYIPTHLNWFFVPRWGCQVRLPTANFFFFLFLPTCFSGRSRCEILTSFVVSKLLSGLFGKKGMATHSVSSESALIRAY